MAAGESKSGGGGGIGFLGLLTIAFIVLKLTGYIDWSWWLVLLPAYGLFALVLLLLGVAAAVKGVLVAVDKALNKRGGR